MTAEEALIYTARWLHLLAATLALGTPIFVRLALQPALGMLDGGLRAQVVEAIGKRWRVVVYVAIVIFLATGLYNFLRPGAPWRGFEADAKRNYHLIFGIKFLLALVIFFLNSALAGRSAALAYFRNNARTWTGVVIVLGLIVLVLSVMLRFTHT